jgi:hypothetical protein
MQIELFVHISQKLIQISHIVPLRYLVIGQDVHLRMFDEIQPKHAFELELHKAHVATVVTP